MITSVHHITDKLLSYRYESIKFGAESRASPWLEITDEETGQPLGGKRAAIQFYFSAINSATGGEETG